MNSETSYCLDLIKNGDKDRYLSVLFAPQEKRGGLAALYAFNLEIARIRETVHEPMLGEIRLRWWRDAITGDCDEASDDSPILNALLTTIRKYNLPKILFVQYCDARIFDMYNNPMPDVGALKNYCRETASALLQLSCHILDDTAAINATQACEHGGIAQAICGLLRLLPITQRRGQHYFPHSIISDVADISDTLQRDYICQEDNKRIIGAVLAFAREHYKTFLVKYNQLPKSIKPALLSLSTIPAILQKIENKGEETFKECVSLSPLHRYLLFLKTAISGNMPSIS